MSAVKYLDMWVLDPLIWVRYRRFAQLIKGKSVQEKTPLKRVLLAFTRGTKAKGLQNVGTMIPYESIAPGDDNEENLQYAFGVLFAFDRTDIARLSWYSTLYNVYRVRADQVYAFLKIKKSLGTIRYVLGPAAYSDGRPQSHVDLSALIAHLWLLLPLCRVNECMMWLRDVGVADGSTTYHGRMVMMNMVPMLLRGHYDIRDDAERGILSTVFLQQCAIDPQTIGLFPLCAYTSTLAELQGVFLDDTRMFDKPRAFMGFEGVGSESKSVILNVGNGLFLWRSDVEADNERFSNMAVIDDTDHYGLGLVGAGSSTKPTEYFMERLIETMRYYEPNVVVIPDETIKRVCNRTPGEQDYNDYVCSVCLPVCGKLAQLLVFLVNDERVVHGADSAFVGVQVLWPYGVMRDKRGVLVYYSSVVCGLFFYAANGRRVPMFSGDMTIGMDKWEKSTEDVVALVVYGPYGDWTEVDCNDEYTRAVQQSTYHSGLVQAACVWKLFGIRVTHIHVVIGLPSGVFLLSTVKCEYDALVRTCRAMLDATVYGCNANAAVCPSACQIGTFDGEFAAGVQWQDTFMNNVALANSEPVGVHVCPGVDMYVVTHTQQVQPKRVTRSRAAVADETMEGWFRYIRMPKIGTVLEDDFMSQVQMKVQSIIPKNMALGGGGDDGGFGMDASPGPAVGAGASAAPSPAPAPAPGPVIPPIPLYDEPAANGQQPTAPGALPELPVGLQQYGEHNGLWSPLHTGNTPGAGQSPLTGPQSPPQPVYNPYYNDWARLQAENLPGRVNIDVLAWPVGDGRPLVGGGGGGMTDAELQDRRRAINNAVHAGVSRVIDESLYARCQAIKTYLENLGVPAGESGVLAPGMSLKDVRRFMGRALNIGLNWEFFSTSEEALFFQDHEHARVNANVRQFSVLSQRVLMSDASVARMEGLVPGCINTFVNL